MTTFTRARIPIAEVPELALERIAELGSVDLSLENFAPWSFSKYKMLAKCPLKFLLSYILKIDGYEECELTEDKSLKFIGLSAHNILEDVWNGVSLDEAYESARDKYYDDLTEVYWDNVLNLRFNIEEFLVRMRTFMIQHPIKETFAERKIAVDRNWNPVDFMSPDAFVRGVIDLTVVLQNSDVISLDHKHGGSAQFGIKNYEEQLDWYRAMVYYAMVKCKSVTGAIHFIKEGDVAMGRKVPQSYIEGIPNMIEMTLTSNLEFIQDMGFFKQSRSNICNYCEFKEICHKGKRGTANFLQPVVEDSKRLL